jgi:argininosuccinate lyase
VSVARTQATGPAGMLPELLAWSSSLAHDRAFLSEDLLGSAAHVTMLARAGLVSASDAKTLRDALMSMFDAHARGEDVIGEGEEDVHMAVESVLAKKLGAVAGRLHTARSRNDQVALDLRLHVRVLAASSIKDAANFAREITTRARLEHDALLPAYTHRQRAQPISASFLLAAWATDLVRAIDTMTFALTRIDEMPLGSGACSGTSLPIDRDHVRRLLGFAETTTNALDTVGDRGFALDFTWAAARIALSLGKMASDCVDYATSEFALIRLDGDIAAGSSMMPQKKNPDVFELVRGKSARNVASVVALLTLVKGLASGYNRDQQEDREAIFESAAHVQGSIMAMRASLPHVHFDRERGANALAEGFTQATDLAEALVLRGVPFREAYRAVGELVRMAVDAKIPLSKIDPAKALAVHASLDADALLALDAKRAVLAKESFGGTGPRSVEHQLTALETKAAAQIKIADALPSLDAIANTIRNEPLA